MQYTANVLRDGASVLIDAPIELSTQDGKHCGLIEVPGTGIFKLGEQVTITVQSVGSLEATISGFDGDTVLFYV
jgi:hypothetical protein